ncbi:MAG: gliding motility-associated C-terminal domain-containing protein [Bacteroidales bacterium]|nr:gliding motility-associated C-terminal domain-containing protein [Bacteroidales bacterium]MDD4217306.1 gliding motility-associated C-terminal domain-containing protein [Bacteroidales bacterium]MDY0142570.1 gliding motility-associated C-terminal domain-containing protein [Bacteroidales bacterium]
MMKKLILFCLFFALWGASSLYSQTNILVHEIPYSTHDQDMWGAGDSFSLDFDYDLFNIQIDEGFTVGSIEEILGTQWGIQIEMGIWLFLHSTFSMHGFTLGSVDVDYPVEITLDFPDHYSFDHGETITIHSWYEVLDGWALETHFPTAGIIALDLEYGFGLNFDIIVCMIDCETIPIIPTLQFPINPYSTDPLPHDSIAIFYLNGQTGEVAYPCLNETTGLPQICEDDLLPIVIPDFFGIGLTGEIDIPYVETEDWLDPTTQCLHASGNDEWMWFNLNIMDFLGFLAGLIPPPEGPAIQEALDFIEGGTIEFEIIAGVNAVIEYFILHMDLHMSSYMTQDFAFCPTILATLTFETELVYSETDPANGNALIAEGLSDTITFAINNDLNITYPCYEWDSMEVYDVTYNITSGFSNHTWDSITFDFIIEAIYFSIFIPTGGIIPITSMPEFCLPEIHIDNSDLGMSQTITACAPAIPAPPITLSDYMPEDYEALPAKGGGDSQTKDIEFCFPTNCEPLLSETFPLGYIPLTWYDQEWDLQGFVQDTVFDGTWLFPLPELDIEINGLDVLCYGDTSGVISVTAINSSPDFTWEYSWGTINTHSGPTDEITVPSGYYFVTLTDTYGCQVFGEMNIADENPPILSSLYADDVLCHGEPTGNIYSYVSGGVPPYTYLWQPSGRTDANPIGVYAGWHYLTITDSVACEHEDSVFINEPDAPISMPFSEIGHVSCYGYSDGYIDIEIAGGTPPYYYIWSNGQLTQDLINIPAGTYNGTVIDSHECLFEYEFEITQPEPLLLNVYTQEVLCYGENTGYVDLIVTGGTPPYQYEWSNGSSSQDLFDIFAGIYVVTVTDAHGCVNYTMVQIQQPDLPLHGNITPTHIRCFGEGNGIADLNVFGGTPPYYFSWSNGEISEDIYDLIPGIYSVTINDHHDCVTADTVQIFQADAPMVGTITGNNVTCNGGDDGNVYISVAGGIPPYNFEWNNGSWQEDLVGIEAGTYIVTATDQNYCHYTMTFDVLEPEPFYIQAMDNPTICYGQSTEIGIGIITGSVPPYTIVWSNDDNGMTTLVNPTETTTYTAHIVDAANCISEEIEITVTVLKPLSLEIYADRDTVCPEDTVNFEVIIEGGGLDGTQVYVNDSLMTLPIAVSIANDSIFEFLVYDNCGYDSIIVRYSLFTYPLPPVNISAEPTNGCTPLTVQFHENSPNIGQRYIWNFDEGDFENLSFDKHPIHTFYNARTYHVGLEIISDKSCSIDTTIAITVFPIPIAEFRANRTNITMATPIVYFTNYTEGGFFYNWDFGDGIQSNAANPSHVFTFPGNYHVSMQASSLYGCSDSTGVDIFVSNELAVYAPTAFTPNHDDLNETFKVIVDGVNTETYSLAIYNRWGETVFFSELYSEEWDGRYMDKECPEGVYSWMLTFIDLYGNEYRKTGKVTLLR